MPRIYASNNDPLDFCKACFPTEEVAMADYGNNGPGPDGRDNCFGYDADHPPYEWEEYDCVECGKCLTEEDN